MARTDLANVVVDVAAVQLNSRAITERSVKRRKERGERAEAGRDKKNVFEHTENAWLAENVEPTTVQLISN